ncbi:MAG: hypothetical protein ACFFCS_03050, partial [Candidatus Hodarchaeota archaeon]
MVVYNRIKRKGYKFWFLGMEFVRGKIIGEKNIDDKLKKEYPNNSHIIGFLNEVKSFKTGFSTILKVGYTSEGTREIHELCGEKIIQFPIPISLS